MIHLGQGRLRRHSLRLALLEHGLAVALWQMVPMLMMRRTTLGTLQRLMARQLPRNSMLALSTRRRSPGTGLLPPCTEPLTWRCRTQSASITTLYVDTVVSQAACLAQTVQQRVCCWVQSSLVVSLAAWVSGVACPSLQGTANHLTGGSSTCQCFCRQGPIALSIFGEEDLEDPEMPGLQVGPVWAPPWGSPVKPGQGGQQDAAPSSGLGLAGALPVGVAGRWQHAPGGSPVAQSGQVGSILLTWPGCGGC